LLLAETEMQREAGGRILLGDYKGGGPVVLRPIRFQRDGVWV
jgi:hypothetical protein